MSHFISTHFALQHFGFRQTIKGALIIGFLVGFMAFIQGYGYIESYPDKQAQDQFAKSMEAAPSLGILYGSTDNLHAGGSGYVEYRVTAFMSLIVAIWGLMAMTKLLRGNEEDGRWEVIRSGATTARSSVFHVSLGFLYAFLLSFIIAAVSVVLVTNNNGLTLSLSSGLLMSAGVYAPALLFVTLGVLVSQLAVTRRRVLLYGLIPMLIAYFIRSIGNTNPDLKDLLCWTPFGWNMLLSPVVSPQPLWLVPFVVCSLIFFIVGIWFAKRDLGSSILKESTYTSSRFFLLKNGWQLALRQNAWVFIAWGIGAIAMGAIVASILDVATNATASSSTLSQSVQSLANTPADLRLAFLGAGMIFVVLVLLILATVIISSIRHDEAKQYLDNILVQPQKRSVWLMSRVLLGCAMIILISFLTVMFIFYAAPDDLQLDFTKLAAHSIAMVGTSLFLIGFGTLLYGILPRFAVIAMYLIIAWSFIIDLVNAVVKIDDWVLRTSLFDYMTFNLSEWPDWNVFAWLICMAVVMSMAGIMLFTKRDIINE